MKTAHLSLALLLSVALFPATQAPASQILWELNAGDREYIRTDNRQRSIAYNRFTGHVYYTLVDQFNDEAGRVFILDALTGADVGELSVEGITKDGAFDLSEIDVADDGTIYGANLTVNEEPFRIYRWLDESSNPELVYTGDPSSGLPGPSDRRWGKNMDVRGTKDAIEIIVVSRTGFAALFTGSDNLTCTTFADLPGYRLERGVAFGKGDTFYADRHGVGLHHFAFDRTAGTTEILQIYDETVFPESIGPIFVDLERRILGGVVPANANVRQSVMFFDLDSLSADFPNPAYLAIPFSTRNANPNGYGGMDFGSGLAFAVNTNNGILALTLPPPTSPVSIQNLEIADDNLTFNIRSRFPIDGNVNHILEGSPSLEPGSWEPVNADLRQSLRAGSGTLQTAAPDENRFFYRLTAASNIGSSYFEDFESGGEGWTSGGANNTWEIGIPTSGPGSAISGQNVAATNLAGAYLPDTDAWLRSPPIDLTEVTEATLSFQEYVDVDDFEDFHGTVVSILDANTLDELEELSRTNERNTGWRARRLTLSEASLGREIVIQFRLYSDGVVNDYAGWYIDDVSLETPRLPLTLVNTTTLASLTVDGVLADGFNGVSKNEYSAVLSGTSPVQIAATAVDPAAIVFIEGNIISPDDFHPFDPSAGLPSTLSIDVLARDGVNMDTYTLTFLAEQSNVALNKPVLASSEWTAGEVTYAGSNAVDGIRDNNNSRWITDGETPGAAEPPQWLEIDLLGTYTLSSGTVVNGHATSSSLSWIVPSFWLEYLDGEEWKLIPGASITGNTAREVLFIFDEPVTTNKVRFVTDVAGYVRILEIEIFGTAN